MRSFRIVVPMRIIRSIYLGVLILFFHVSFIRAQWIQTGGLVAGTIVNTFAVSGSYVFAGTYTGVFLTTDYGKDWTAVNTGLPTNTDVLSFLVWGTHLFAGTYNGAVYFSSDSGFGWMRCSTGLPGYGASVRAFARIDSTVFVGTGQGVYMLSQGDSVWTQINAGLPYSTSVEALCAIDSLLIVGTWNHGAFVSTDKGTSWNAINSGLKSKLVVALTCVGTNVFAGTDNGVFHSTNLGTSWTPVDSALFAADSLTATTVISFATFGENIFASSWQNGVFESTNGGTSFNTINAGLTNTDVLSLAFSGGYLFAGTERGGVFRRSLSELITSVHALAGALSSFPLSWLSFSPNPARDVVNVHDISAGPNSVITLSNVLGGRLLSTHVNATGEQTLDVSKLRSGMYILTLRDGAMSATRMVSIVR